MSSSLRSRSARGFNERQSSRAPFSVTSVQPFRITHVSKNPPSQGSGKNEFNPGQMLTERTRSEQEEIGDKSRPDALLIHETIRAEGESELARSPVALAFSGLAAGLSMGFSLLTEALLRSHLPAAGWRELVSKFGYCAGFLIVVLGRQQLFTENTLTPILPLLHNRDGHTLGRVARLWAVVLVANLIGTALVGAVLAYTPLLEQGTRDAVSEISLHIVSSPPLTVCLRAVFAGWLIALMVWLLPAVEGAAALLIIVILTYIVSLGSFSHLIAGSVDASFLLFSRQSGLREILGAFFLPTLLGNVAGGVALVAMLNYGQIASEIEG